MAAPASAMEARWLPQLPDDGEKRRGIDALDNLPFEAATAIVDYMKHEDVP